MTLKKRLRILMADDGSQHAQAAVDLIRDVSLPAGSRVMLLRVFTPDQIEHIPEFERGLEKTHEQISLTGAKIQTELVLGSPAEKIIEISETEKIDLIVLGAKGLRSTLGILLGGVAQQVVEYACRPVLIVRAPYQGLHRILLVTDGSSYSQQAARYLSKFPFPETVDVRVMHVMPPLPPHITGQPYLGGWHSIPIPVMTVEEETAFVNKRKYKGQAILKRTCDVLQRNGIRHTPVLKQGDAATEILEYASANEINLIVAGSRGLSQFKGWWTGSVSRKLVHYSNCSVLIVKRPKKE